MDSRCCSSWPGFESACDTTLSGWRVIQPKISVDAATRAELRRRARVRCARAAGAKSGEDVADGGRRDERADEMAAAALVLLRRAVAVLVRADRDVLGAVIRGELRAAQREHGRREREQPREKLLRGGPQALRLADAAHGDRRAPTIDASDARALHRQLRGRQRALHLRQQRQRLREPRRARAGTAPFTLDARKRLRADATSISPSSLRIAHAHEVGPVHEHAVRERHAAEPDLLVAHAPSG